MLSTPFFELTIVIDGLGSGSDMGRGARPYQGCHRDGTEQLNGPNSLT